MPESPCRVLFSSRILLQALCRATAQLLLIGTVLAGALTVTGPLIAAETATADLLVVSKIRTNGNLPGNLAFVHLATGEVVGTVPVGNEPHEVAISSDGRFAVVSNTGSYQQPGNTLSVIDVAAQRELHRVDLGPLWNPHGLTIANGLCFFTVEGSRAIGAYSLAQNRVVWLMGTGQDSTHMVAVAPDGRTVVATNRGSASITILTLKGTDPLAGGAWKSTIVPVGEGPEGLDFNPAGAQVWVGCHGKEICIVDLVLHAVVERIATPTSSLARLRFSPDGRFVIATDNRQGHAIFIDPATHVVSAPLALGHGAEAISFVPDGRHALISVTGQDNVAEIELTSHAIVRRFSTGQGPDCMAWIANR